MESQFDPDVFMNSQMEAELETEFSPVPVGDYMAQITKISLTPSEKGGKSYYPLNVFWRIDAPDKPEAHERLVKQTIFLDIAENGGLAIGKNQNVPLGKLRAALGQNGPQPWAPSMLEGAVAMVKIKHRVGTDAYAGRLFDEVESVGS